MTSWNHDSNYITEQVVGVAAAAYVITSIAEPSSIKDKNRKEGPTFSTWKPGIVSEQFSGEGSKKVPDSADIKVLTWVIFRRPAIFTDNAGSSSRTEPGSSRKPDTLSSQPERAAPKPERATSKPDHHAIKPGTPATRPELPPTPKPVPPVVEPKRQHTVRPGSDQAKADAWEKAEMVKIKDRYVKLNNTILEWEEKKKKKARSKLDKAEKSESEKKRARALTKFRNEMDYIKQVADGARAQANARQRNDELKAKEKANIIRTTGELPMTCFCC
ncbi:hypothetical protein E1A91_A03G118800v1 [Gossypium mustelinum]|uniref:Remorin C-terminal domain-containing protein n=1 Tax=Gossypium mustelinum TaxID=34275 RepID=A0A5D2ZY75_GOSMU|nr:hypothetical protein E1A91_A03G118800v1 [Gossypium mustelinum]